MSSELKKRNIPFSPPDMSEEEARLASEAILSGWITTGPKTKEFEKLIAEYCGTDKAVCLNSATACMEMILHILGVGPGDEVITSAYTYSATASVTCHVGAKVVMVDTAPDSFEMDYSKLADAITANTKVVIPVDLGGVVCDYNKIYTAVESKKHLFKANNDIQKAYGRVVVLADAAHAFGAKWHGKRTGSIADFTSFSFHAVKNLTTAEGGALTWKNHDGIDNEAIYKQFQLLSLHGQNKDALAKTMLGAWEYDIIAPNYKCNMTDIMAGIGLAQFKRYPDLLTRRREIVDMYNKALGVKEGSCYGDVDGRRIQVLNHYEDGQLSSCHLYLVRLLDCNMESRNGIINKMAERGIACNVHYKPLPMMTAYKKLGFDIDDYPNAYNQFCNEITLPLHTRLTNEDVNYIIENFVELIKEIKITCCSKSANQSDNKLVAPAKRIFLSLAHMSGHEQRYIQEAFETNWVAPLGPNVNIFENVLEAFVGENKKVVALSSGTAAVHLALLACGVGPGDEVIVQSFTFCASVNPIVYLGAVPVFVDSESETWNMDPKLLEEAIKDSIARTGKKPKAIMPVTLYGMPYKIEEIMEIADRYEIPVIEDSAEGFGSRYKGRVLGTFGKFGVFSFNGNKMITTSGGGALICEDDAAKREIMFYATQARENYAYYHHEKIGFNYRMSNICAGIGRGQMFVADEHIKHHQHICKLYEELLKGIDGIKIQISPSTDYDSNYWLNTIIIEPWVKVKGEEDAYTKTLQGIVGGVGSVTRDAKSLQTDCQPNNNVEAMRVFLDNANIEVRPFWKPMHKQPIYKNCPAYINGVSEDLFKKGLCLPSGPCVTDEDVKYIVDCIKDSII